MEQSYHQHHVYQREFNVKYLNHFEMKIVHLFQKSMVQNKLFTITTFKVSVAVEWYLMCWGMVVGT